MGKLEHHHVVIATITLILSSLVAMGDFIVIPIFPHWYADFPNCRMLVDFAVSGPMIGMLAGSLLVGRLVSCVSKKYILAAAALLFLTSSFLLMFIYDIRLIVALRLGTGLSCGLSMVSALSLLNELYDDKIKRGILVGLYNAVMAAFGIVFGIIAGALSESDWRAVFYLYLVALPLFVMVLLFVPKTPIENHKSSLGDLPRMVTIKRLVVLGAGAAVLAGLYNIGLLESGIYVEQNSIGSSAVTGFLTAADNAGSLLICLVFGFLYKKFGGGEIVISFAGAGLALLLLCLFPSLPVSILAFFLSGVAYANAISFFPMHASVISGHSGVSMAIGVMNASIALGGSLSTFMISGVMGILATSLVRDALPLFAGVALVGLVLSIILSRCKRPSR